MRTKWCFILCILFHLFLPVGSLGSAAETLKRRRKLFKPGLQKAPKRLQQPESLPGDSSPPPPLSWSRSFHSSSPVVPSLVAGEPQADVSVTCSAADFVVRVQPAFYGLGADAHELTLGSSCKSNGVLRPPGDMLFSYPLTECDGARELPPGYLVYKYVLHYDASPKRFPSIAQQLRINIECHYERNHSVHQLAVQPTWQTVVLRKTLKGRPTDFQINFMDEHTEPEVYLLGQTVNIQVSAPHLPPGWKLYINSCYAAPTASMSSLKYAIIDNLGCMVDSKHEPGASWFVSRTDNAVQFSLRAFQFTADPETEVSIRCKLSVTTEGPDPVHKSCTYQSHRWESLLGHDFICECCDSTCASSEPQRALLEGFASSAPLHVSDQPYAAAHDLQPVSSSAASPREDKNPNLLTDLNQKLWESLDVEKHGKNEARAHAEEGEDVLGETKESDDLDNEEVVLEELEANNLKMWKTGSEHNEGFSEHPEAKDKMKGSEDDMTEKMIHENQKDLLDPFPQVELMPSEVVRAEPEPPVSEEKTEKTRAYEDDKDGTGMLSKMHAKNVSGLTDEDKMWVFTWT